MQGNPAELLCALIPIEDAQSSFPVMRLSAVTRMTLPLRTLPPSIRHNAASKYNALQEYALA